MSGARPADGASAAVVRAVAAIDLGATSGRVMIGRVGDGVLSLEQVARFANGPVEREDGWHWDIEALWGHVREGLAEALRREPAIESVGIDSWAVDYGLLRDGDLVAEPFHYRDERTARGVDAVHAVVPFEELYRRNGLQFLPFNTVYQYAADAHLAAVESSLLIPDLFAERLTGRRVAERTNASTTGLLDVHTGEWDVALAETLGIPASVLPPLVEPGETIGATSDDLGAVPVIAVGSLATPGDMPARIATLLGCDAPGRSGRPMFARIIVESIALAFATALRTAATLAGREIDVAHLVGGGALNALLCQATADRAGLPVLAGPVEATALGNVLVQARALGVFGDDASLADLRARVASAFPPRRFDPRP